MATYVIAIGIMDQSTERVEMTDDELGLYIAEHDLHWDNHYKTWRHLDLFDETNCIELWKEA